MGRQVAWLEWLTLCICVGTALYPMNMTKYWEWLKVIQSSSRIKVSLASPGSQPRQCSAILLQIGVGNPTLSLNLHPRCRPTMAICSRPAAVIASDREKDSKGSFQRKHTGENLGKSWSCLGSNICKGDREKRWLNLGVTASLLDHWD